MSDDEGYQGPSYETTDFHPHLGESAFQWLERCQKRAGRLFQLHETASPDKPLELTQSEGHGLLDALHHVQLAWMHWRRSIWKAKTHPPLLALRSHAHTANPDPWRGRGPGRPYDVI
jgi:hypothetical protein